MTHNFEVAPPPHNTDWDKCVAFALPPAAGVAAAIAWFEGNLQLGLITGAVCFVGTFICAWPLARSPRGYVRLTDTELQLGSGWMQTRVAFADLDLAAASRGNPPATAPTVTSLVTHEAHSVRIPRRGAGELVISVAEPAEFLAALHTRAQPARANSVKP